jgi:hypothetical protein
MTEPQPRRAGRTGRPDRRPSGGDLDPFGGPELWLTPCQRELVVQQLEALQRAPVWHGGLPVLLLERCWLRLSVVAVDRLLVRLPPDGSRDAPELVRWRALTAAGLDADAAQQQCWNDFGPQAFQAALRRFWQAQERGNHSWTHDSVLELLRDYRRRFERSGARSLPLLVLARSGETDGREPHRLHWLCADGHGGVESMRHTCA